MSMNEPISPRKARFNIGDRVRSVGPSARSRQENIGTVTDVIVSAENVIYRYRVKFSDGGSETFYGFELEPVLAA
jgi:hypothetical protein